MMKYSFKNDYSELAHPDVLAALAAVGDIQFEGYGLDEYTEKAARLIVKKISKPSATVHFIGGGTAANLVTISSVLRPHEAIIAPQSGHISAHETGAIEATGHKVCTVKGENGKLSVAEIEEVLKSHHDEHMVKPKMVFVSQSTEVGSIYSKAELTAISACCRENDLYLHLDGARLGTAMHSPKSDMNYQELADLVDTFYIGGTKNGALCGEAIVICNEDLTTDFRYHLKQKGGLLAKGATLGIQFLALFENQLYERLATNANAMALRLAKGFEKHGYGFLSEPQTNQIFPVLPLAMAEKLSQQYGFYQWQPISDEQMALRFVTSWATRKEVVDEFVEDLSVAK